MITRIARKIDRLPLVVKVAAGAAIGTLAAYTVLAVGTEVYLRATSDRYTDQPTPLPPYTYGERLHIQQHDWGCTTDTDCMEKFGGDGGPEPAAAAELTACETEECQYDSTVTIYPGTEQ